MRKERNGTVITFIIGALTLSPAPGEEFDLTIQLADQLLNYISGSVYLEVDHEPEVPPGVLLQLNGIQYAYTDRYLLCLSVCLYACLSVFLSVCLFVIFPFAHLLLFLIHPSIN